MVRAMATVTNFVQHHLNHYKIQKIITQLKNVETSHKGKIGKYWRKQKIERQSISEVRQNHKDT